MGLPIYWIKSMADSRYEQLKGQLSDPRWRLNNLYWIMDKTGKKIPFRLNWAQEELLTNLHHCNLILKARQLGFTTAIQIFLLDQALFNSNVRCGTIAHRLDDAKTIFRDKVRFPYDHLPEGIRSARSLVSDSAEELLFSNNSSIRVGTSLPSGTLQYLHISEYGSLCAMYPDKASEVRTGSLNTLQAGQTVFIESTAAGREGHFYAMCEAAQAKARMGTRLTELDFKFQFYPWWKEPSYAIDPAGVTIGDDFRKYFEKLESGEGIKLTDAQKAWYVKKSETQLEFMRREYPSTPAEAFEASLEGAYYAQQLAQAELQGRVGNYSAEPTLPINTAWDLGIGDSTAIWFWQINGGKISLLGYYENSGEGLPHYVDVLKQYQRRLGWQYGQHIFPLDARARDLGTGRTRVEELIRLGIRPTICPAHSVDDGIAAVRQTLPLCYFAADECSVGLRHLRAFRKDWNEALGTWKDKPRHDQSSHAADAFRYLSMAWRDVSSEAVAEPTPAQIVKAMISQPRTYAAMWSEFVDELR
jgi:hypothetical protein